MLIEVGLDLHINLLGSGVINRYIVVKSAIPSTKAYAKRIRDEGFISYHSGAFLLPEVLQTKPIAKTFASATDS